jgi:non-specific serine/threonine protein kinase/serine/threonine-protein kinase
MEPGRWQRVEALFHEALERPPDERAAFVAAACDDADVRAEVEQLLHADDNASAFVGSAAAGVGRIAAAALPDDVQIGAYRIVRELGRGGMGTVYLGVRADAQFDMRVAIKLIKRGMDSDGVLGRFRHERQILAGLEHPNIARLLDGGTTPDGLPYFVMEYVDGKPIDEYCRAGQLTIDQRLDLFRQVCAAVSYAHQHLVVHRDIKPSNILVTAAGVPKLVDFGIAKLLESGDADLTLITDPGGRAMTPQYASPEQLRGERVTTVSDVYALGVLLYELLAGERPYELSGKSAHVAKEIVETADVAKPSATAAHAGHEGLARQLRGDLDTIVLTAMRQEPAARYASVALLSDDVRRHGEGLPVVARGDSWTYRAARFVRRRKLGVAAAAAIVITLIGGVVATSWQARVARAQEQQAQQARALAERRFSEVRKLANSLIFDYHDAIRDLPGSTPLRARLVRDALSYLNTLAEEAEGDANLQRELAVAYRRVADVQGGSTRISLGDTTGAADSYRKGLTILEALQRRVPDDPVIRRDVAQMSIELAYLMWESGDLPGAIERARRAQVVFEPLLAVSPLDLELRLVAIRAYDTLGAMSLESGRTKDALDFHRRQLDLLGSAAAAEQQDPRLRRGVSVAHHHLADVQSATDDLNAALQSYQRSLAIRQALEAEFPNNSDYRRLVAISHFWVGDVLAKLKRTREALDAYRRSLEIGERLAAADPASDGTDISYALVQIGNMLGRLGGHAEALRHYRRAETIRATGVTADAGSLWKQASLIEIRVHICGSLAELGRSAEASAVCAATVAQMNQASVEPENSLIRTFFADSYSTLGDAYAALARSGGASGRQEFLRRARDVYAQSMGIYDDLRRRGILAASDAAKPAATAGALAKVEASLAASGLPTVGAVSGP